MCDNCNPAPLSNEEMLDLISTFLSQKQAAMNELEQENAKLREELAKYGSCEIL